MLYCRAQNKCLKLVSHLVEIHSTYILSVTPPLKVCPTKLDFVQPYTKMDQNMARGEGHWVELCSVHKINL